MRNQALLSLCLFAPALSAQNWITFNDETTTRLAITSIALPDLQEKDLIADDFDQDGDEDLVCVRKVEFSNPGGMPNLLLMNEGGNLVDRTATLAPGLMIADDARDILSFDADGDGWLDLCIAMTFGEQPRLFINQGNDGMGVWQGFTESIGWIASPIVPGPQFCAAYEGDVDNDGDLDLYFSDYNSPLEDQLLINDGTGFFTNETATRFPTGINDSAFGTASFVCDMNNDGWNDIVKISGAFEPLKILFNDGTGVFTQVQEVTTNFDAVYMGRVKDYDNDGRLDIYVVDDGSDYVIYNDQTLFNGTILTSRFNLTGSPRTNGFGGNVKAADIDRDGFNDLGVCDVDVDIPNCGSSRLAFMRNEFGRTGVRGFTEPSAFVTNIWNTPGTHDVEFFDIDSDGFLDAVVGTCSGYNVFMQDPFAAAEKYGQGCGGLDLSPIGGVPALGNGSFGIELTGAPAGAPTNLLVSIGRGPLNLGACDLLVDPALFVPVDTGPADGSGTLTFPIPIPNDPMVAGGSLDFQMLALVPGGPLFNVFSLSNGLEIHVSANALP